MPCAAGGTKGRLSDSAQKRERETMTDDNDITAELTRNEQLSAILDGVSRDAARLDMIEALVNELPQDNWPVWQVIDVQLAKMNNRQEEIFQILSSMQVEISLLAARQLTAEKELHSPLQRADQAERPDDGPTGD